MQIGSACQYKMEQRPFREQNQFFPSFKTRSKNVFTHEH